MSTSTDRRDILKIGIDPGGINLENRVYAVLPSPGSGAHQHQALKPALADGPALQDFHQVIVQLFLF